MTPKSIEAVIGENGGISSSGSSGYIGEMNAEELVIELNEAMSGADFYTLAFDTHVPLGRFSSNSVTVSSSPACLTDGAIHCPLEKKHTSTGLLDVQVNAYFTEGTQVRNIVKSDILHLSFKPSVDPERLTEGTAEDLTEEIRGLAEYVRRRAQEGYTLPPASADVRGGIRPDTDVFTCVGDVLTLNFEGLGFLVPMVVCSLIRTNDTLDIVVGPPDRLCYTDDPFDGLSGILQGLGPGQHHLWYVPTGMMLNMPYFNWTDDSVRTVNAMQGLAIKFEFDEDEFTLGTTVFSAEDMLGLLRGDAE